MEKNTVNIVSVLCIVTNIFKFYILHKKGAVYPPLFMQYAQKCTICTTPKVWNCATLRKCATCTFFSKKSALFCARFTIQGFYCVKCWKFSKNVENFCAIWRKLGCCNLNKKPWKMLKKMYNLPMVKMHKKARFFYAKYRKIFWSFAKLHKSFQNFRIFLCKV